MASHKASLGNFITNMNQFLAIWNDFAYGVIVKRLSEHGKYWPTLFLGLAHITMLLALLRAGTWLGIYCWCITSLLMLWNICLDTDNQGLSALLRTKIQSWQNHGRQMPSSRFQERLGRLLLVHLPITAPLAIALSLALFFSFLWLLPSSPAILSEQQLSLVPDIKTLASKSDRPPLIVNLATPSDWRQDLQNLSRQLGQQPADKILEQLEGLAKKANGHPNFLAGQGKILMGLVINEPRWQERQRLCRRILKVSSNLAANSAHQELGYALAWQAHGYLGNVVAMQQCMPHLAKINFGSGYYCWAQGDRLRQQDNKKDDSAKVLSWYRQAQRQLPKFFAIFYCRALWHIQLDEWKQATTDLQHSQKLAPYFPWTHYAWGETYWQRQQNREALTAYRKALNCCPDVALFHYACGRSLRKAGQKKQAMGYFKKAISLDNLLWQAYVEAGDLYRDLRQEDHALAFYLQSLTIRPQQPQLFPECAQLLYRKGDWRQAVIYYSKAISEQPSNADYYLQRARAYQQLGQQQQSIADLSIAIAMARNRADFYLERALLYLHQQKQQRAFEDFRIATSLDSRYKKDPRASHLVELFQQYKNQQQQSKRLAQEYTQKGDLCRNNKQYYSAIDNYRLAIANDSKHFEAYIGRAFAYHKIELAKQAISDFTCALQIRPDSVPALYYRGICHMQLKQHQIAINDFSRALAIRGANAPLYYNRALAAKAAGKTFAAIKDMGQALALSPQNASWYLLRGDFYKEVRLYDQAQRDFSQAIRLDPGNVEVYHRRAEIRQAINDLSGAIADYSQAVKMNPRDAMAYYRCATIHYQQRQYHDAFNEFDKVIRLAPDHADAYVGRGRVYYRQRKYVLAIRDWQKAIGLVPSLEKKLRPRIIEAQTRR